MIYAVLFNSYLIMKNLISKIFMFVVIAAIGILFSSSTIFCPPGNYGESSLYPNPDDCRKFYECDNGMLSIYDCPDGTFFCSERGACDFANSPACSYRDCNMPDDNGETIHCCWATETGKKGEGVYLCSPCDGIMQFGLKCKLGQSGKCVKK